jgi:hypothetical protein
MDHHCPWVGNCIGFKNHKFFILLAIYGCLGCLFGFVTVLPELLGVAVSPLEQMASGDGSSPSGAPARPPAPKTSLEPPPPTTTVIAAVTAAATAAPLIPPAAPWNAVTTLAPLAPTTTMAPFAVPTTPAFNAAGDGSATSTIALYWRTLVAVSTSDTGGDSGGSSAATGGTANASGTSVGFDGDVCLLLFFAVFSFLVSVLLASLLASHLPLACANLTTIEENYENMENPFAHGSYLKNLQQILGAIGPDWLLPIMPRRPLSDGVSFPRSQELLPTVGAGLEPEDLWKLRYASAPPPHRVIEDNSGQGPLGWVWNSLTGA